MSFHLVEVEGRSGVILFVLRTQRYVKLHAARGGAEGTRKIQHEGSTPAEAHAFGNERAAPLEDGTHRKAQGGMRANKTRERNQRAKTQGGQSGTV